MLRECTSMSKNQKKSCDCLKMGDFLFVSGQLPLDYETDQIVGNDIEIQTHQVMKNILRILDTYHLTTKHIMRTTIFLTDMEMYDKMNEVYASYFDDLYPSRSVVGVSSLPHHAMIEINCDVIDTRALEVLCGSDEDCSCCN